MTRSVATVGPAHTLRQAAAKMAIHSAGDAVVLDPDAAGPEIVTEHDILVSLARGQGPRPGAGLYLDHLSSDIVYASPSWSRELAAVVMVDTGRRHLVVCEGGDLVGTVDARCRPLLDPGRRELRAAAAASGGRVHRPVREVEARHANVVAVERRDRRGEGRRGT